MRLLATALLLVAGCGSRAVGTDGGVGEPNGLCCAGVTTTLSGTLDGQPIAFDHTYYGITVTWGEHANPVSPAEATDLSLLLADQPYSCSGNHYYPVDVGPLLRLEIGAGTEQPAVGDWIPSKGGWTSVDGTLCLESVPIEEGEPVGWNPVIADSIPGCATLRFEKGGKPAGQASGRFTALRCPSMDEAYGE